MAPLLPDDDGSEDTRSVGSCPRLEGCFLALLGCRRMVTGPSLFSCVFSTSFAFCFSARGVAARASSSFCSFLGGASLSPARKATSIGANTELSPISTGSGCVSILALAVSSVAISAMTPSGLNTSAGSSWITSRESSICMTGSSSTSGIGSWIIAAAVEPDEACDMAGVTSLLFTCGVVR